MSQSECLGPARSSFPEWRPRVALQSVTEISQREPSCLLILSKFGLNPHAPGPALPLARRSETCYGANTYTIDLGTRVMQQSKDCWGPDAKMFKPERWLPYGTKTMYNYWLVVCLLKLIKRNLVTVNLANSVTVRLGVQ